MDNLIKSCMAQCQCLENYYDQGNNEQNVNGLHTFWSEAQCIEPNYEVQMTKYGDRTGKSKLHLVQLQSGAGCCRGRV